MLCVGRLSAMGKANDKARRRAGCTNKGQNAMATRTYTAVFARHNDWWIAWAEEVPGAISQERTLEEARESLGEAIQLILEVNRDYAPAIDEGMSSHREPIAVSFDEAA
jgi:predicted RNase H-like HicB family nuclease